MDNRCIIANWKGFVSIKEATALAAWIATQEGILTKKNFSCIISPSFPALIPVREKIKKLSNRVFLCAQDCSLYGKGAYTGEVSPELLQESGCRYVLIGHSERRHVLGEQEDTINKKLVNIFSREKTLTPILCIGESGHERAQHRTKQVLERQLRSALKGITLKKTQKILFAYEPTWAIGSGNAMNKTDWGETLAFCRDAVRKYIDGAHTLFFYGGSVSSDTIRQYLLEGCGGVLVGTASTTIRSLRGLINQL